MSLYAGSDKNYTHVDVLVDWRGTGVNGRGSAWFHDLHLLLSA